jgi:hypothetical protein
MNRKNRLILFFVLILCVIIIFMNTWDSLAKNQTDPETIEEAINRIVSAHNNEPTSHAEDNQSIAVHRTNDILDHKAGAVLADKWTMSELDFSTTFDVLTPFGTHGNVTVIYPGVHVAPSASGDANYGKIAVDLESRGININYAKDFTFQFAFQGDLYSSGSILINFGFTPSVFVKNGVGLELTATNKRFFCTDAGGANPVYLLFPTYDDITPFVIRIQNIAQEGKMYVYINGQLLGTMIPHDPTAQDSSTIVFAGKRSSTSGGNIDLYNLFFSLQL